VEEEGLATPSEAVAEEEATPTFFEDVGEIVVSFVDATVDTVKAVVSIIPGVDVMGEEEEEEEDTALMASLQRNFTPLSAFAFMVFVLLYTPCMVAIAAQRAEFGTRWMLFGAGYLLVLAWVVSVVVYQGGLLLGYG
jgi:ferrous iron transport protein B